MGWNGTFGYSDYLHASKNHTSSVGRIENDMHRAYGDAGFWSNAKYTKVPPTGLHYWWAHTN
ncbi:lactococcin 972 family bacteriocin [Melissococcus plutonius]|uniref:lactococcin 972 family bacteriocin n=1 Tax=Melissococcus plutonius TaxID=33970 RepID=UPI0009B628EE|nr:lactococcin 972 family bacteriocin [Melissococcus plutonius]MCV2499209.1 lactococcin 972 family bacteriocin [Melissococcus plutonius]MCV2501265.1 lactococcin 972 family bacteriocin [Melissococcus plutonius]MCV2505188.1 lactococcin 972 family bacteriocin [Melissococcus plutonius]MCV2507714.1 lactococcin 972 family bacteriocin [Melissococcus plutonius]MCV2520025.1 lactococcin 972 family bacteriocin [Melissococcus plutonius]